MLDLVKSENFCSVKDTSPPPPCSAKVSAGKVGESPCAPEHWDTRYFLSLLGPVAPAASQLGQAPVTLKRGREKEQK